MCFHMLKSFIILDDNSFEVTKQHKNRAPTWRGRKRQGSPHLAAWVLPDITGSNHPTADHYFKKPWAIWRRGFGVLPKCSLRVSCLWKLCWFVGYHQKTSKIFEKIYSQNSNIPTLEPIPNFKPSTKKTAKVQLLLKTGPPRSPGWFHLPSPNLPGIWTLP